MRRSGTHGFTLIEMIACIAIIFVLGTIAFISYRAALNSSGSPRCISNMRNLHTAFSTYVQDNGYWPQQPDFDPDDDVGYAKWWITTMHPYVSSDSVWICPTIQAKGSGAKEEDRMLIHYTPTQFDAFRNRPFQWSIMPWLIEAGNAHGAGANVLFPDGSVRPFSSLIKGFK